MSEEKEKALELKYAPGKCSHFIMGDCMISKYDKSCGIDCDTCDTYYYYNQLQAAKEENEKLTQQNKQMQKENEIMKTELISNGCIYIQGIGYLKGGE